MSHAIEQEYDALPYAGEVIPHAHAGFLESVARLRGLRPTPAAEARVLELGCGVGANLLPMAERYPNARFLGIDLSGRQIEMARAMAQECQFDNVVFRQADVMQLNADLGEFDYIFNHGVYSWVDAPVRDKLLFLSRHLLAEQGVAYVGYKTYPAWHQLDIIRETMLAQGKRAESRGVKIGMARQALAVMQQLLAGEPQKNQFVLENIALLMQMPDDYLWHEYLEPINHPVTLRDFLNHAQRQGLKFIGDGAVGVNWFDDLGPELERQLASQIADPLEREQFRDVVRNRAFRQTLLCRQELDVSHHVTLPAIQELYLEGAFTPENPQLDVCSMISESFVHRAGGRVTTSDRLVAAAMIEVGNAWPGFVRFDELIAATVRRLSDAGCGPTPEQQQQLQASVVECCARLIFQVHCHAAPFAAQPSAERPQGSRLARAQAKRGNRVANRRHEPVMLNALDRWLLPQFDGQSTAAEVIERTVRACNEGKLIIKTQAGQPYVGMEAQQLFETEVPASIKRLTESALLVA